MYEGMASLDTDSDHKGWPDQTQGNCIAKMARHIETRDSVLSLQKDFRSNDSSMAEISTDRLNPWPVLCPSSASPATHHQSYETDGRFSFELCLGQWDLTEVIE
jgi:hypothetical protein